MEFSQGFPQLAIEDEIGIVAKSVRDEAIRLTNELLHLGRKITFPYRNRNFIHQPGCANPFLLLEERPRYERYTVKDEPDKIMDGTMWYLYAHCSNCHTRLYIPGLYGVQKPPEDPEWWANE